MSLQIISRFPNNYANSLQLTFLISPSLLSFFPLFPFSLSLLSSHYLLASIFLLSSLPLFSAITLSLLSLTHPFLFSSPILVFFSPLCLSHLTSSSSIFIFSFSSFCTSVSPSLLSFSPFLTLSAVIPHLHYPSLSSPL